MMTPEERARIVSRSIINETAGRKIRMADLESKDSKLFIRLGSSRKDGGIYAVRTRQGIFLFETQMTWVLAKCRSWYDFHCEIKNAQKMQQSLETV